MSIKSFAHQVVYFCIGLLIIFFQILPLQTTPQNWSGPNVLLVFFATIVTQRPEYTSSFLIALIISFYFLKRKIQNQEENSLIFVWVNVAISLTLILLIYYIISVLLFLPSAGFSLTLMEILVSLALYPIFSTLIGSFDTFNPLDSEKKI